MAKIVIDNYWGRNPDDYDVGMSGQISFKRLEQELRATENIAPGEIIVEFEVDEDWIKFKTARRKKQP